MKRSTVRYPALATCGALLALAGCANQPEPVSFNVTPHPSPAVSAQGDARYTPEALKEAFATVCRATGYQPLRVEVDQSESPFIVYGVLAGRCDYGGIRDALASVPGYAYAGCFTSVAGDGSRTLFALNLTPYGVSAVDRPRLHERLRQLGLSLR